MLGNMHTNGERVSLPELLLCWLGWCRSRLPRWRVGSCLAEEALRSGEDGESCSLPLATGIRQELGTAVWCSQCQLLACLVNYLVNWLLKFPTACPLLHSGPAAELFTLFSARKMDRLCLSSWMSCREEPELIPYATAGLGDGGRVMPRNPHSGPN